MTKLRHSKKKRLQPVRGNKAPLHDDLITQFLTHVTSSPDTVAIVTTEKSVTYQELYFEVIYWKSLFNPSSHCAIICLDRTPRLLAVLLALQWLGITYIPVDPSVPAERLRTIIDDSQAQLFIYDSTSHIDYTSLSCQLMNLSEFEKLSFPTHDTIDAYRPNPNNIAYIIYTSGSTGKPKGVAISHRALTNFLASMSHQFLQEEDAMVLAVTTITFDIASLELYLPLWNKKSLFMANQKQHKDPLSLKKILNEYPITLLQTTPSLWVMLLAVDWSGKSGLVALSGGEQLTQTLAQSLLTKVSALWNMYGPTEATVWCSLKQIHPNEPITVGRPIDNMEMRVMDSSHHILPPYVKGKLYVGGVGLAEGYVNNERLTQSKFISCKSAINGRLYNVGDIACSTPNGEFIIFGRSDNQIKLHGYRIELEEIEAHIQTVPDILECAVTVHNDQLIAYLCLSNPATFSEKTLVKHLELHLPSYMLPHRTIILSKLPTSNNGKINRKALPLPPKLTTTIVTELSPLELTLTHIWAEELQLLTVGIHDNFFELGGHSLLAARIISKIAQQIKKRIALNDFYLAPTIAQFTHVIELAPEIVQSSEIKSERFNSNQKKLPLHDFQLMLWIGKIFEPQLSKMNVAARKRVQGPLNKIALNLSLQLVFQKQEMLSYTISPFYPTQKPHKKHSLQWMETSLLDYNDDDCESVLLLGLNDLFYHQKWRIDAPMIVAKLYYLKNDQLELHVCMSHLISDEHSLDIFFHDLSNAYLFYTHHGILNAQEQFRFYKNYVLNQMDTLVKHAEIDTHFWKNYLQDAGHFHFPQKYFSKKREKKTHSPSTHIEIPELLLKKLRQLCVQNQVTLNDGLCAAIGLSLLACCNNEIDLPHSLILNTVKSTRDNPNYDQVIGCFLRIHPIKLDLKHTDDLIDLSKKVQRSTYETAEHQRASSLIKLASIGQLIYAKKSVKTWIFSLIIGIFSRISPRFSFTKAQFKACLTLASVERKNNVLINVNILNNFFFDESHKHKQPILGVPNPTIPLTPYLINIPESVFDVCFHRSNDQNKPFVVISSPLSIAFQKRFGVTLLDVIQKAL
ncbi:MAG: non-ribosomal peptide synthetase [Legionellaceae bacterium]|nr:non-ribosomal peptide synthetase [Legionellaceae bacterium]